MNPHKRLPIINTTFRRNFLENQKTLQTLEEPALFKIRSTTDRSQKKPKTASSPTLLETRSNFFETLKTLPNQHRKGLLIESPTEIFLKECEEKCLNPLPIGAKNDSSPVIDLSNYSMGDNYAAAFGKSLKRVSHVEKLNISSNSLSPRGLTSILSSLSGQPIKELSMKDNTFDLRSLMPLLDLLNKPAQSLRYLNLENTKISDRFVAILCEALYNHHTLNFLGLAKNALGYVSCRAVKSLLVENQYLKQLDFHWNNCKDFGALMIFEGLCKNDSLKELDISWNSIGKNKEISTLRKISESFPALQGLVHLDISFNFFTAEECEVLGEGLLKNTEILGIHFLGNQGNIDSQGFITADKKIVPSQQTHLFFRMFDINKHKGKSNCLCWICEGWKEMDFIWDPVKENKHEVKELFIHLDCDDYRPDSLTVKNGTFQLSRVLPPGEVKFFFSDGKKVLESSHYEKEPLPTPFSKSVTFVKNHAIEFLVRSLHKTTVVGPTFNPNLPFKATPRKAKFEISRRSIEKRVVWKVAKSLFKDYKFWNSSHVNDCLEFDWKESKIENFVKQESERVLLKEVLRSHYIKLTEIFRLLASQSGNEYLTVGNNVLTDFFYQTKVFDQLYSLADLGVNWNAVTVHKNRQPYNPITSLCRYEFIELIVRVALDRFVRTKMSPSISEAVSRLMNEKLGDQMGISLDNSWRMKSYITEEVDIVYKTHRPILENVFKRFSGKKSLPGQKPFMSVEEFKELCIKAGLLTTPNPERDLEVCFGAAMMVQVDEIYAKKHVEMNFVEFLEALARVSTFKEMTGEVDDILPRKIESNLNLLIGLCSKTLRENFTFPNYETYRAHQFKVREADY
jgi:hypothetical protein